MTISEIYKKYKIMPQLQLHQLRVAAVAKQICDNLTVPVDVPAVISTCLLHDMGNIIKFDLSKSVGLSGGLVKADEVHHWQEVQKEYVSKYGPDEHVASITIARELGVNNKVLDYIGGIDFKQVLNTSARPQIEPKICDNADLRVVPNGIVSIEERFEEGRKRYAANPAKWIGPERWQELTDVCREVERQVFAHCKIKPEDITEESTAPIIEELKSYEIPAKQI